MDRFAIGSGSVAAAHEKSLRGRKRRGALGSAERVDFAAQDIPHAASVDRQVQAPPHPGRPAHMDAPRGCHRPVERRKHVIRDTVDGKAIGMRGGRAIAEASPRSENNAACTLPSSASTDPGTMSATRRT